MQPLLWFCMQSLMVFYVPPLLGIHQLRYSALFVFCRFYLFGTDLSLTIY
ncbi:hypothetical protein HanIR_Chr14g0674041 [Helianthus annuus]|nr:hypothetical protein HanIR_Chr14g0674041 [Helianthus annuus]